MWAGTKWTRSPTRVQPNAISHRPIASVTSIIESASVPSAGVSSSAAILPAISAASTDRNGSATEKSGWSGDSKRSAALLRPLASKAIERPSPAKCSKGDDSWKTIAALAAFITSTSSAAIALPPSSRVVDAVRVAAVADGAAAGVVSSPRRDTRSSSSRPMQYVADLCCRCRKGRRQEALSVGAQGCAPRGKGETWTSPLTVA
eukprot:5308634-Prymnesium_polylepis.2